MTRKPVGAVSISIVVPFYNVEAHIASCIEGLLAQNYPRDQFEIVCVDNCSTDKSAEIVSRYPGVRVIRQPVPGSYAARNLGIAHTKGDIVATIDPDCRPQPDWLSQIALTMTEDECCIVLGQTHHAHSSFLLELLERYESEKVAYITDRRDKHLYFGYTNNMAFRRTLFDKIGLFPERARGGDTIFVQTAVNALGCDVVTFNPKMRATHLELDTVGTYYSKRHTYGSSNERISHVTPFRPLRNSERWEIFKRLVRRHKFPLRKTLMLVALLAPGVVFYEAGRRFGNRKLPGLG